MLEESSLSKGITPGLEEALDHYTYSGDSCSQGTDTEVMSQSTPN